MLTNTNRILYNGEYIPAYIMETTKKIRYKGSNYSIGLEETKTDRVYKVELDTCVCAYLSPCNIEVEPNHFVEISRLREGDFVLTYLDNQRLTQNKVNARSLVLAFLGNKNMEEEVKDKYKIKHLNSYKLLRNHVQFLSSFITELVRESTVNVLMEWQYLNGYFSYELLQELSLAFSMFGIKNYLRKTKYNSWRIYINIPDFLGNILDNEPKYIVEPVKILSIKEIRQDTQAYKVNCSRLVVNGIMIMGDN